MTQRVRRLNEKKVNMPIRYFKNTKIPIPPNRTVGRVGQRSGAANPNWRSGKVKIGSYHYEYAPGHRKAVLYRDTPYVLKGTLKLEGKIGRKLRKYELPHHKDGVKSNDSLRNLSVMSHPDHRREHSAGKSNAERHAIAQDAIKRTQQFEKEHS